MFYDQDYADITYLKELVSELFLNGVWGMFNYFMTRTLFDKIVLHMSFN